MNLRTLYRTVAACAALLLAPFAAVALTVDSPQPITHLVTVQPIVVSDDGGVDAVGPGHGPSLAGGAASTSGRVRLAIAVPTSTSSWPVMRASSTL